MPDLCNSGIKTVNIILINHHCTLLSSDGPAVFFDFYSDECEKLAELVSLDAYPHPKRTADKHQPKPSGVEGALVKSRQEPSRAVKSRPRVAQERPKSSRERHKMTRERPYYCKCS